MSVKRLNANAQPFVPSDRKRGNNFVVVDIDGYSDDGGGDDGSEICTRMNPWYGQRARECGLAYCTGDGQWWTESIGFVDDRNQTKLGQLAKPVVWWVYQHLTGLPLDPTIRDWSRTHSRWCIASSRDVIQLMQRRIHQFAQTYGDVCVLAKGGHELTWLQQHHPPHQPRHPKISYYDLQKAGCPKVEALAMMTGDVVNCGGHHPVKQRFVNVASVTTNALHCPLLEVRLFLRWWLEVGYASSLLRDHSRLPLKPVLTLIQSYLLGNTPILLHHAKSNSNRCCRKRKRNKKKTRRLLKMTTY